MHFSDLYTPRFIISKSEVIAAAGSCFAQHIGAQFKRRGYNFLDVEPPPPLLPEAQYHDYGFDLYSARYGNVYSVRQLLQLLRRARGEFTPKENAWTDDKGRVRDPFRPSIEPDGFASLAEMEADRAYHLSQVAGILRQADLFVFTFGLTEAWECVEDGAILPTCPGTIGGSFDPERYRFKNFTFSEVMADAEEVIALARAENPEMKFLFTVSPVPLTATATDDHVLSATVYSKSVLRAVCGELRAKYDAVDYFPSYELVASHPMRAMFYMPNLRTVAPDGVKSVMEVFFAAHRGKGADVAAQPKAAARPGPAPEADPDDVVCDEEILEAFGR
ncbi:GSCFA domain-containing protein [Acidimangrovimonas pyrenivorans]|uniref:GSCFA domain-containing protein n=1 Tax=Acidimangrovimonas pyrenivorans TaxID=2030798 RepID=A0ABV7AC81_9RHOB